MNNLKLNTLFVLLIIALMLFPAVVVVFADENIDPDDDGSQYSFGENVGWLNFEPQGNSGPGVEVEDTQLTGYIWCENIGWINLAPSVAGVFNDEQGNLSGFGWAENVGWINFAPTGGGVTIDGNGRFHGYGWGENIGWINFDLDTQRNYGVKTSWAVNNSPITDAGPDQTVEQTSSEGADVILDGSGSSDQDGDPLTYLWGSTAWGGGTASGVNPTVSLPLGSTTVILVVEDDRGGSAADTVVITVEDTTPPDIIVPEPVTVEQESSEGATVSFVATATDICDSDVTITSDEPPVFPLGITTVTYTAIDDSGNMSIATTAVNVIDTTPPSLSVLPDAWVEQESFDGTFVDLSNVGATDICDSIIDITSDSPSIFQLGTTVVTFTATDDSGNSATDSMSVTVVDTTAPMLTVPANITVVEGEPISLTASVTDICDASVEITDDAPDPFPLGVTNVTFTATDDSGNMSIAVTVVTVVSERGALIELFNSTNGNNWNDNSGWKAPPLHTDGFAMPGTEGSWKGITVDASGHVTHIHLNNNMLDGPMPSSIGNLKYLQHLQLDHNWLSGPIPTELGNLTELEYIQLTNNHLTGNIPGSLGNLTKLYRLYLSINSLTGTIPPILGNLTYLDGLWLNHNQLTGTIPPELGAMDNLRLLYLDHNQLSGSIPPELGSLIKLESLEMAFNQLSGSIPPELGDLPTIKGIDLERNQLSGPIPPELGNLRYLRALYVHSNQLSGEIPAELADLADVQYLFMGNNQLSGSIPPDLGSLAKLQALDLGFNQLSGSIPADLGDLTNLGQLYLYHNQLSGPIPPELENLDKLTTLFLEHNELTGEIPAWLGGLPLLHYLTLGHNQFTGSIPPEIGNLDNLRIFGVQDNQLSGSIPSELGDLNNVQNMFLFSNKLTGPVPTELLSLSNLVDGGNDFMWNALYTHDDAVREFLNAKQRGGDWESTQTVAPTGLTAGTPTTTSVPLSWNAIPYTVDAGGYEVYYSETPDGAYTLYETTATKSDESTTLTGFTPGTRLFLMLRTVTTPHNNNTNTVFSEYTDKVETTIWGAHTPEGTDVAVSPIDETTGDYPVSLSFDNVTQPGTTRVSTSDSGPPPPSGFKVGTPSTYFEITTSAIFDDSITVCINYTGLSFEDESELKLFHYENGEWTDATISQDMANDIICGSVVSLSTFAVFETANRPPVADTGADQVVEQASQEGTLITLDASSSSDPDSTPGTNDDIISFEWYEGSIYLGSGEVMNHTLQLGSHSITLIVEDSFGETDTATNLVTVEDTTNPELSVTMNPSVLWPPNHKMVQVVPQIVVSDICDSAVEVVLVQITMNEVDIDDTYDPLHSATEGDGKKGGDVRVDPDGSIYLRAERSGKSDGRTYTLTFNAVDESGNETTVEAIVTVPHDMSP